jgi:hypothetical protein
MNELINFANGFIRDNPEFRDEVYDLLQLCRDEIEEGGSPEHEIQLCEESIRQLID